MLGNMIRVALALSIYCLTVGRCAGEVVIADKGQAKADIVIAAEPSAYVNFAATELKQYLDKITGSNFRITSNPTALARIHLGQSPEATASGLQPETLKQDGFFISAQGNDVFIVGVDNPSARLDSYWHLFYNEPNRGTILGVYEFLEQLGVRWFAPGPDHEVVPRLATLTIAEGTQRIEPFHADRLNFSAYNFMYSSDSPDAGEYCRDVEDAFLWGVRIKLSSRQTVIGCHSEDTLKLSTIWADHPERFALNPYRNRASFDGKHHTSFLCWTDPALLEMWTKAADVYFSGGSPAAAGLPHLESWPWMFILKNEFMIDPSDHWGDVDGRCRCDRCNAFREKHPSEDDSEIMWKLIAEVAESIREKHPGKFITTLVYPPKTRYPKHVKVPDNVRVRICISGPIATLTPRILRTDLGVIRTWATALGVRPVLWTYQCHAAFGRTLPGVPETYPRLISQFVKETRNDIGGMYLEQHTLSHTAMNLDKYISARLMWNPNLDIEAELADYFEAYYGPGAEPAQKLFKLFEDNWVKYWRLTAKDVPNSDATGLALPAKDRQMLVWSQVYTSEEMKKIDALVAAVERACGEDPAYSKRAKLLRTWILDIMKLERAEVVGREEARRKIIVRVPVVKAEPSAADWAAAPVHPLVSASRLKPQLAAGGEFQLLRCGDTLRLRVRLDEPAIAETQTRKDRAQGDPDVWQDNDVEVFLFSEESKDLWQIIINDHGNWASQKTNLGVRQWKQMEGLKVAVERLPYAWTAEATIPLRHHGAGTLRYNLTRHRNVKGEPNELSTWSHIAGVGNWHDPDHYGTMIFEQK